MASALNQDLPAGWQLEVLIGVDGCPDTLAAAQRITDPRVTLVNFTENHGTYNTFNSLFPLSHGSLFTRFDADDIMVQGRLYKMIQQMVQVPRTSLVATWHSVADENLKGRQDARAPVDGVWMWRRSFWVAHIGGFMPWPCGADTEALLRAEFLQAPRKVITRHLYIRRQHDNSLTGSGVTKRGGEVRTNLIRFIEAARARYAAGEKPSRVEPIVYPGDVLKRRTPLVNGQPQVTASLASIPGRRAALQKVVAALLPQVDALNVYLNASPAVEGADLDPAFLRHPKITVERSQDTAYGDQGDAGKFYWANDVLGFHFVVDDDLTYPPNYVQTLIDGIERHGRKAVVGLHGVILQAPFKTYCRRGSRQVLHYLDQVVQDTPTHILGTGVLAYHTDTIRVLREDFKEPNMADIWLGLLGQKQNVPFICLAHSENWMGYLEGTAPGSLYREAAALDRKSAALEASCQGPEDHQTRAVKSCGTWRTHPLDATPPTITPTTKDGSVPYEESAYWNKRYLNSLTSGGGSQGAEALWKQNQIVRLAEAFSVKSIVDFGSGDGEVCFGVMKRLAPSVTYRGYDISNQIICQTQGRARANMRFAAKDFGKPYVVQAEMVLCIDVLFHQSTPARQTQVVANICASFEKVALVTAWNPEIVKQYGDNFAAHTFYRPFEVPDGIEVEEIILPMEPGKTLFVLTRKDEKFDWSPDGPGNHKTRYQQGGDAPRPLHDSWHRGPDTNFIASKGNLGEPSALVDYVLKGWSPSAPIIKADGQVLAIGSCFAQHIAAHLRKVRKGLRVNQGHDIGKGKGQAISKGGVNLFTFGAGFVTTLTVRQQFEWALGEREIKEATLYVEGERDQSEGIRRLQHMPVGPETRAASRAVIEEADVIIITVGLAEIWYDILTGEAFFGAVPTFKYNPERHGFRVTTVEENRENLIALYQLLRRHKPGVPIIFTVSPIPLIATFRPVSCLTANSVSKAIVRVAVDELMRAFPDDDLLLYWPSYEIVMDVYGPAAFQEDRRHIRPAVVTQIMETFEKVYVERGQV